MHCWGCIPQLLQIWQRCQCASSLIHVLEQKRYFSTHTHTHTPTHTPPPPTPLHYYGVKRGPRFLLSNRGRTSLVFSGQPRTVCPIAFLHANMAHHWAMGDMVSQREERSYLSNEFLCYFKIIDNIR